VTSKWWYVSKTAMPSPGWNFREGHVCFISDPYPAYGDTHNYLVATTT